MPAVFGFLFRHWRRHPALIATSALGMAVATLADLLLPIFAGRLVGAVATGAEAHGEAVAALTGMAALGLLLLAARHVALTAIVGLTLRIMADTARDAFARVQRFSTDWHANTFAGSIVRKVTRGMWAIDLLNDTLLLALLPGIVVLVGATVTLGLRWPALGALVGVGAVAFVVLAVWLSLAYVAPAARLSNSWDTRISGALADAITCNPVVKSFGAEAREDARLAAVVAKWGRRTRRTWLRMNNTGTGQGLALLALRLTVLGTTLLLWARGHAGPGDVAFVLATYFVVHDYLRDIGYEIRNVQRAVNDMEELVALHAQPLGVEDPPGAAPIRIRRGAIAFQRVGFRYAAHAEPLFRDFSVEVAAGERVGLVGHSGSGKSSFVKLLQRLYDVGEGRVLIDGQDIAQATQASLRAQIAVVQQEPVLFHRSLAENIAYARPSATAAEIARAARLANADQFIERLPKGYATLVGERGIKLSGGERQRVALARAFLADAPVLILDEATSSLDSESEALIQQAMERLLAGRTAIVIAHRLSTVRALDRILVFDRGRVIEDGPHADLLCRPDGLYRRLFERQALGLAA